MTIANITKSSYRDSYRLTVYSGADTEFFATFTESEVKDLRSKINLVLPAPTPSPKPQSIVAILHGPTGEVEKEITTQYTREILVPVFTREGNYLSFGDATSHATVKTARYVSDRPDLSRGVVGGPCYYHFRYAGEG
jgi:hypothetical protein